MWAVNGMIGPLIVMLFWVVVSENQTNPTMTSSQFITYYVMLTLVDRLTGSWTNERLSKDIKSGAISKNLVRPLNHSVQYLANDLSSKFFRIICIFPLLLILISIFKDSFKLPKDPYIWTLFFLAAILGFAINFLYQATLALTAFFIEETNLLSKFVSRIVSIFEGSWIPLVLLPVGVGMFAQLFFARFIISFPLEIILGQTTGDKTVLSFGIGLFWLTFFILLHIIVWKMGIKRYTGIGI